LRVKAKKIVVFLASFRKNPYLCNVFFIVLDLRLTKFGSQRRAFFISSKFLLLLPSILYIAVFCHEIALLYIQVMHPNVNEQLFTTYLLFFEKQGVTGVTTLCTSACAPCLKGVKGVTRV